MKSIFNNKKLFQLADFTFMVADSETDDTTTRGNIIVKKKAVVIKFKLKFNGGNPERNEYTVTGTETYTANFVDPMTIPEGIKPGSIGTGTLNGCPVTVEIQSLGQSGVSPITIPIVGAKCQLAVTYQLNQNG